MKQNTFTLPTFGDFQIYNVLAGAAVCRELGFFPTEDELKKLNFDKTPHRGQIVRFGDLTVVDDCYNANPVSMIAGLKSFKRYVKDAGEKYARTIVVLGDMLELGSGEIAYHQSVGKILPELDFDLICTVGKLADDIGTAAVDAGIDGSKVHHFADAKAVGEFMIGNALRGDVAYLKASRGIALDKIFDLLKEKAAKKN